MDTLIPLLAFEPRICSGFFSEERGVECSAVTLFERSMRKISRRSLYHAWSCTEGALSLEQNAPCQKQLVRQLPNASQNACFPCQ